MGGLLSKSEAFPEKKALAAVQCRDPPQFDVKHKNESSLVVKYAGTLAYQAQSIMRALFPSVYDNDWACLQLWLCQISKTSLGLARKPRC